MATLHHLETTLTAERLAELLDESDAPLATDAAVAEKLRQVLAGERRRFTVDLTLDGDVHQSGAFTVDRFRYGVVRRALEYWLENHDAAEIGAALQYAMFDTAQERVGVR